MSKEISLKDLHKYIYQPDVLNKPFPNYFPTYVWH